MLVTTKWISFSLSLSLSISFSFSLFLTFCPSVSLYISLSLYLSLFLSLSLSPGGVKQKEAGAFGEERKRSESMHGNDQQLSADSHQFISENVLMQNFPRPKLELSSQPHDADFHTRSPLLAIPPSQGKPHLGAWYFWHS
jgi:hypothetical protein